MIRKPMVAGNWKMHLTVQEALNLCATLIRELDKVTLERVEVVVAPAFVLLQTVQASLKGSGIRIGAQDVHWEPKGAFTGEVSGPMLVEFGVTHVIVGHSERRHIMRETDEMINKKVRSALQNNMTPILCVGETLEQRQSNLTQGVVETQIRAGFQGLSPEDVRRLIIAYEPVWAIGTGVNATPEQAEEVHGFIRALISEIAGKAVGEGVKILYGGSVSPDNISGLIAKSNVDGALVGGASLKADSFAKIVRSSVK